MHDMLCVTTSWEITFLKKVLLLTGRCGALKPGCAYCLPALGQGSAGPEIWWDDMEPGFLHSPSWHHLEKPPKHHHELSKSRRYDATFRRWWEMAALLPLRSSNAGIIRPTVETRMSYSVKKSSVIRFFLRFSRTLSFIRISIGLFPHSMRTSSLACPGTA